MGGNQALAHVRGCCRVKDLHGHNATLNFSAMNDTTLEQIQTKIAFLERANTELGDQVYRQHQEIEMMRRQLGELADRLNSALSEARTRTSDEERPPHY